MNSLAASGALEVDIRELPIGTLTPIDAYRILRNGGTGAVIECAATPSEGKRAFVAFDPLETLTIRRDPAMLETIRATFKSYQARCTAALPGYGLIGTFAYDAALTLRGIPTPPPRRLFPDALAFVPGTWLSFDTASHRLTVATVSASKEQRDVSTRRLDLYTSALMQAEPSALHQQQPEKVTSPVVASFTKPEFLHAVGSVKNAILRGDVYQLVLSIQFAASFSGKASTIYDALSKSNPSPYLFLVENEGRALIGASPEFLVRLRSGRAELRPLAGTRRRGTTDREDAGLSGELVTDPKERFEHAMLVDLGRNDLSKVCRPGSVRVERAFEIERYSHVMHMASLVSGQLDSGYDAFDLFGATFPAGTVTGAPKRRAMELIATLEPTARDLYAGSVLHAGFDGSLDAAITLRSIALAGGRALWQAGAGIVHQSRPDAEYDEVLAKSAIARAVLGV